MTDPHEALDVRLRHHRDALFGDDGEPPHVADERLIAIAEGRVRLGRSERRHVASCTECRDVLSEIAGEIDTGVFVERWWERLLRRARSPVVFVPALAAAVVLLVVVPGSWSTEGEYATRGAVTDPDVASVSLLAVGIDEVRRDLHDGERVRRGERLGFRYGNPKGLHKTLAVLGWDGARLHWYYPESPKGDAFGLQTGADALSRRLPFDVRIGDEYRAGKLTVVLAFDEDPQTLAAELARGALRPGDGRTVYRLQIEERAP